MEHTPPPGPNSPVSPPDPRTKKKNNTQIDNVKESEERNPGHVPRSGSVPTFYGVYSGLRIIHPSFCGNQTKQPTNKQANVTVLPRGEKQNHPI